MAGVGYAFSIRNKNANHTEAPRQPFFLVAFGKEFLKRVVSVCRHGASSFCSCGHSSGVRPDRPGSRNQQNRPRVYSVVRIHCAPSTTGSAPTYKGFRWEGAAQAMSGEVQPRPPDLVGIHVRSVTTRRTGGVTARSKVDAMHSPASGTRSTDTPKWTPQDHTSDDEDWSVPEQGQSGGGVAGG